MARRHLHEAHHPALTTAPVVYHGWIGSAPFQPVARRPAEALLDWCSALVPLATPICVASAVLGVLVPPALLLSAAVVGLVALYGAIAAHSVSVHRQEPRPKTLRLVIGFLHLAQPPMRLLGRLRTRPIAGGSDDRPARMGDRLVWVESLGRECALLGATVRPGGRATPGTWKSRSARWCGAGSAQPSSGTGPACTAVA